VRLRLTLTYSALFVVAGAALLSVSYLLVSHREHSPSTDVSIICNNRGTATGSTSAAPIASGGASGSGQASGPAGASQSGVGLSITACASAVRATGSLVYRSGTVSGPVKLPPGVPAPDAALVQRLTQTVAASQAHTLNSLLLESGLALGFMTIASVGLGWWVAGRVLRPVHRITDAARRLSEQTLHDRINLDGPHDELKELADTFDAMLARLDRAFNSQRRFVANASHELRTPLATERVLIDEALANRSAGREELRAILEQLRVNSEDTERLIDALLVLARSERGLAQREPVDLAYVAAGVVEQANPEAVAGGIEVRADVHPATFAGDSGLVERLVGNLVENAIRHNVDGGWVSVTTSQTGGQVGLLVANSGRILDPEAVPGLVEPFRRDGPDRSSTGGGFGLGLSIVAAIVTAHGGQLDLAARSDGGLDARVRFSAAPPGDPATPEPGPVSRSPGSGSGSPGSGSGSGSARPQADPEGLPRRAEREADHPRRRPTPAHGESPSGG
jgi:signal transduction histidine kinase